MPRTKVNCQSCSKPITDTRTGGAKVLDFGRFDGKKFIPYRIYLHPECYEKDNREARESRIRPKVGEIIERVVKAHAPTWQELAKR